MLRSALGSEDDLSFRARGAEVSRIEGFSDAVFGFAMTLLVMSGQVPTTFQELSGMWHALLPFMASFAVLFGLWKAQFDFFRRYGLEDRRTIQLTALLMMIVLMAVYPVRFLFSFILDVLPRALLEGNDSMRDMMTIDDVPKLVLMYAAGFFGVTFVFSRLYRHAATRAGDLGLSAMELFDTRLLERRWRGLATIGLALSAGAGLMVVVTPHRAKRDTLWTAGYVVAYLVVIATSIIQRRGINRRARERAALMAGVSVPTPRAREDKPPLEFSDLSIHANVSIHAVEQPPPRDSDPAR